MTYLLERPHSTNRSSAAGQLSSNAQYALVASDDTGVALRALATAHRLWRNTHGTLCEATSCGAGTGCLRAVEPAEAVSTCLRLRKDGVLTAFWYLSAEWPPGTSGLPGATSEREGVGRRSRGKTTREDDAVGRRAGRGQRGGASVEHGSRPIVSARVQSPPLTRASTLPTGDA